jgi:serine/threonine-protein kinase
MELVEGPTLADRLAKGPVPLDEALLIARQIADALEAAHDQGVIHRDLKPANIKVREDGTVKVLDFGLAKLADPVGVAVGAPSMTQSPTITTPAMTAAGIILGTAAYMAPEQARAKPADKRSDIWAFGCVLYEMLTGTRAFEGEDISDVLASVLKSEPDWTRLPSDTPPAIRVLLERCVAKDRRQRIADISAVRFVLTESSRLTGSHATPITLPTTRRPLWRRGLPFAVAALVSSALGAAAAWGLRPAPAPPAVTRFTYRLPSGQVLTNPGRHYVAISPDGTAIAYIANRRIYRKLMREVEAAPIPGTEGSATTTPVFSPDGQFLAFFSDGALKRIAIGGGTAVTLCQADNPFGMSWDDDNILVGQGNKGILRVPAGGGLPEVIVGGNPNNAALSPQVLPGGSMLYTLVGAVTMGSSFVDRDSRIVAQAPGGEPKTILTGGSDAHYVSTGHLVYSGEGVVYAVPFDVRQLKVTGTAVPVVEGVGRARATGVAQFAISKTGSLVYGRGGQAGDSSSLDVGLADLNGTVRRLSLPRRAYYAPRVSPDGRQLAIGSDDGKEADIFIYDLSGGSSLRKLTFGGRNRFPLWTPDGQRVAFQSDREGDVGIFWQRADGSAPAERVTKAEPGQVHAPDAWSPAGDLLLFDQHVGGTFTTWTYDVKERKAAPVEGVRSTSAQPSAALSHDGRWIAYASGFRNGPIGIYVRPFPATDTQFLIGQGTNPFWSPDGKTLYYSVVTGFMSVGVRTTPTFSFTNATEVPRPAGVVLTTPGLARNYEMTPDGKHFVVVLDATDAPAGALAEFEVVLNWTEELKQRVPTK